METTRPGRPRAFDAEVALDKAMTVFWRQGYDSASLVDLTEAMGISRKSMYAAFGSKEQLFHRALQRYGEGPGAYIERALLENTALEVATTFLTGAVQATTSPEHPPGCLGVQGALVAGEDGRAVRDTLTDWRMTGQLRLAQRFQQATEAGDLPADADAGLIARYLMTVANGVAVQAAGGAGREELQSVADIAMRNWPPA
ncbi:TetR/AcrR family transcriptional regulator [Kineococcus sp. SYSU DK005]|uniref:TetR/AcrR family transcriptional regulator n=1 Tax=Kineococcus sp. SYSU DK005 TaxID=3383126 RepID=UPI003D7C7821